MKYVIVKNDYQDSIDKAIEVEKIVQQYKWIHNKQTPDVVFVIGGDGTFLKAVAMFNGQIDHLLFVPIKSGGIGFYTNHNRISNIEDIIKHIKQAKPITLKLLEANHYKAINEIKIVNNLRPLRATVYVNDEILEDFKGTGLAFTTPSGSTGFAKSQGGAVIIDEDNIFQMLEMAPVANNIFRTINAPIIFSKAHHVKIVIASIEDVTMIIDGAVNPIPNNGIIDICLSKQGIKLISAHKKNTTKIQILKDIFTLHKKFGA